VVFIKGLEMVQRIPTTVVDNFFETPSMIRKLALSLEYTKGNGIYPGVRSKFLHQIDPGLARYFNQKIFSLFYDFNIHHVNLKVESMFHMISSKYEEGWIHNDLNYQNNIPETDWEIAGLVYLTPDAPISGGTSLYRVNSDINFNPIEMQEFKELKRKFYQGEELDLEHYRQLRDQFNNSYTKTTEIGNVYNRLVVYNASDWHRGNIFFGNNQEDSRLTLVFFAKMKPMEWVQNPIERSKSVLF
jgi:hypothetical protein